MYFSVFVVAVGGALGSLLRWYLGARLNGIYPALPLGTLSANIAAGYFVGIAVAYFARSPALSAEWRLFVITGLMGGLSTFSTFSAEVVNDLGHGKLSWAFREVAVHLSASILMTMLGIATVWGIYRLAPVR